MAGEGGGEPVSASIMAAAAMGLGEMDKSKARKQAKEDRIQATAAYEDTSQRAEATRRALFKGYTSALAGTMGSLGMDTSAMTAQMAADPRAGTFRHLPAYDPRMDDPRSILKGESVYSNDVMARRKEMTDADAFGIRNQYMQDNGIQGLDKLTPEDSQALTESLKAHYAKWGEAFDPKILQERKKKTKGMLGSGLGLSAIGTPGAIIGSALGDKMHSGPSYVSGDYNVGSPDLQANPGDRSIAVDNWQNAGQGVGY